MQFMRLLLQCVQPYSNFSQEFKLGTSIGDYTRSSYQEKVNIPGRLFTIWQPTEKLKISSVQLKKQPLFNVS